MKQKAYLLIFLGGLFLLACGIYWPVGMSPRSMGPVSNGNYASNGEQIYFTATNKRGETIRYSGGPSYGGMMGARLACVSCHGEDGQGGLHWMHMQQMDAPDIRYSALISDHDEGEEGMPMVRI